MAFREHESKRLESNPLFSIGDVTTVNLTTIKGGVQSNVIPPFMDACFDIRLAITVDHKDFEKQVNKENYLLWVQLLQRDTIVSSGIILF